MPMSEISINTRARTQTTIVLYIYIYIYPYSKVLGSAARIRDRFRSEKSRLNKNVNKVTVPALSAATDSYLIEEYALACVYINLGIYTHIPSRDKRTSVRTYVYMYNML